MRPNTGSRSSGTRAATLTGSVRNDARTRGLVRSQDGVLPAADPTSDGLGGGGEGLQRLGLIDAHDLARVRAHGVELVRIEPLASWGS